VSLTLAIALIAFLDVALLAGLAYAMAAPRRLSWHRPAGVDLVGAESGYETAGLLGHDTARLYDVAPLYETALQW
jgi:hypothetical protein